MAESRANERFCEDGGGGRAVACVIGGLRGSFFHELRAHVFDLVAEFDFFRDAHAVLRDGRSAPALVEHGVAATGTEGALDGGGEFLNASEEALAGFVLE